MRMSKLPIKTLREPPAEAEIASHRLMLRAGLIHQVAAGLFDNLPLGLRVKRKVEDILRQEMEAIGGLEVQMPLVQPAELWQQSGRWAAVGSEMARLRDSAGRDLCLGMTHEELVTDLAASHLSSYKQLPFMLFQIHGKFRDEQRPRGGLIRAREFTMKDGYSFHADAGDLDAYYPRVLESYHRIFRRAGLSVLAVESDPGMMGGSTAHEFMALTPIGEDTLLICPACDYRANRQVAGIAKPEPPAADPFPLEPVDTPGTRSIQALAEYLDIDPSTTAKAVFLMAELEGEPNADGADALDADASVGRQRLVFAVLRGDMELGETKLAQAIGARSLRPATDEEIRSVGAEPGFASPVGLRSETMLVVADDLVVASPNLVAGANQADRHLRNVNHGRDWQADVVADLVAAEAGQACPHCSAALDSRRGIEVGNIFKLGSRYSEAMGARYLDEKGRSRPAVMGCYGIGVGRLVASLIEASHDDQGIIWPISVAPFPISLISLAGPQDEELAHRADAIYDQLRQAGLEPLYDDRAERAGVKFNDADLLGMPIQLILGRRGFEAGRVESKLRATGERGELPLDELPGALAPLLETAWQDLEPRSSPEASGATGA